MKHTTGTYFLAAAAASIMAFSGGFGCSPSQTAPNDPADSGALRVSVAHPEGSIEAPAVAMPFELRLSGEPSGSNTRITATVTYRAQLAAGAILSIEAEPPAGIIGASEIELPAGAPGDEISKEFIVTGENPQIQARVQYIADGFGAEMHESYPKTNAQKRAAAREAAPFKPLPAPINVDGQIITHGIEVTPQ